MDSLLTLSQVSLTASIGSHLILQGISFHLAPGEFIGLAGPSGAGKSSLLRLLNRLLSPSSGQIYFQGRALETLPVTQLRQQMMLVGQECRLLRMTAREALHYPLKLQNIPEAKRASQVRRWLEQLRLPADWLERTELELSGGQQQQIALARALVTEPVVLLLDEPTSALDLGTASRLLSVIRARVKEHGLAVIMSNHQLEILEQFCDRILYLEKGRLLKDETSSTVDWQALRQALIAADADEQEEWGEV